MTKGNSFFSLPKCKVVFVRRYLTCKVVPYIKILVENERPYKKPCNVLPYKKNYLKMSALHVMLYLTNKVVPYKINLKITCKILSNKKMIQPYM